MIRPPGMPLHRLLLSVTLLQLRTLCRTRATRRHRLHLLDEEPRPGALICWRDPKVTGRRPRLLLHLAKIAAALEPTAHAVLLVQAGSHMSTRDANVGRYDEGGAEGGAQVGVTLETHCCEP